MDFADDPEQAVMTDLDGMRFRAGFRFAAASDVAGGPIEVEFYVESSGPAARYLLVSGDRMRQRPGGFQFTATLNDNALGDPFGGVPDMGGPGGVVEIGPSRPWHQTLVLNQFVRLEAALGMLRPGASGQLKVHCRRPVRLTANKDEALAASERAPVVEAGLQRKIVRDDARLKALVDGLMDQIRDEPREQRERPLSLLLSLRAPLAVERWRALEKHPDPLVFERVKTALRLAGNP